MRRLALPAVLCCFLCGLAQASARTDALIQRLEAAQGEKQIRLIRALGRFGKGKAVAPLLGVFDVESSAPEQTAAVVEALSRIGGKRARQALRGAVEPLIALSSRGGPAARAAFEALGEIGDKRALPAMKAGLRAEKTLDKLPAAYALARLGEEEGENILESAMEPGPEGEALAVSAAGYLARLNKESGLDYLTMMLGADHNPAQLLAVEALGRCGNPKAVLHLAESLQSEEAPLRLAVARALGRLGGSRAFYALKEAKNDPNAEVRAAVAAALEEE